MAALFCAFLDLQKKKIRSFRATNEFPSIGISSLQSDILFPSYTHPRCLHWFCSSLTFAHFCRLNGWLNLIQDNCFREYVLYILNRKKFEVFVRASVFFQLQVLLQKSLVKFAEVSSRKTIGKFMETLFLLEKAIEKVFGHFWTNTKKYPVLIVLGTPNIQNI